ncbi:MAG TPA: M1 family aminopeptidase [Bryobacteraceae bacterium]|nr:M1 family aminopeptidase [Bryobacteraceae bacterium]
MARKLSLALALVGAAAVASAQQRPSRIDVQHYGIEAEVNPRMQTIRAKAQVEFVPQDETSTATFELNNALDVSKVEDEAGRQVSSTRQRQNFSVILNFAQPLPKGKPARVVFYYDGRLTGKEDSPVFGIKFAALNDDHGFLLYPARWFPVAGYTTDRFTADLKITVPAGYTVLAPGIEKHEAAGDGVTFSFAYDHPSFPGSIAIVQGDPARITAEGVTTSLYFRGAEKAMASAYAEEVARLMVYLTGIYGLPPQANLTLVETEDGAANGYSAPGLIFLSPQGIGKQVAVRLLTNQVARQWWGALISPATRGGLWLTNGMARYSEILYLEHTNGPSSLESETRDLYIDALTMNDVPIGQTARLDDYSPEFWSLTASKGAAVLNMLRYVITDAGFEKLVHEFPGKYAWSTVKTEDFEKVAEAIYGQKLRYFFLQWIESSGAPEFKMDYTIYRTQKGGPKGEGGFRVMGKVSQDLDTFRMPVDLKIETEGNPEQQRIDVMGTSTEFSVDTFGKPKSLAIDPLNKVLRFSDPIRVQVEIRRGEQFAEIGEFNEALKEYQKALEVNRASSLAHYRIGETFFLQDNYQSAANEFREAINGNLDPKWTEVWSHINLGKIFDITGQRERAVSEYTQAVRTRDNTQGAQEEAAKYLKTPFEKKATETAGTT